jgi:hypothetical protein
MKARATQKSEYSSTCLLYSRNLSSVKKGNFNFLFESFRKQLNNLANMNLTAARNHIGRVLSEVQRNKLLHRDLVILRGIEIIFLVAHLCDLIILMEF